MLCLNNIACITRDIKIKKKLTVTKGERGGDNGGKGKGHQTPCIKDPWTKPKRGRTELEVVVVGMSKVVAGKQKQLYLNNNKKSLNI